MNDNNVNNVNTSESVSSVMTDSSVSTSSSSGSSATSSSNSHQILCNRCGSYYPSNQRYCMKCGALNYNHPDNQSMKQYMKYDDINYRNDINSQLSIDSTIKVKREILITNIILHILVPMLLTIIVSMGAFLLPFSYLAIVWALFGIVFLFDYSMCLLYDKAGEAWWSYFIPIYGLVIYFKISMFNGWYFLFLYIPIIGWILSLISVYKFGIRFGKNGWLTLIFPLIMIPYIAFSDTYYTGSLKSMNLNLESNKVIDSKGHTESERKYGTKKKLIIITLFFAGLIVSFLYYEVLIEWGLKIYRFLVERFNDCVEIYNKYN